MELIRPAGTPAALRRAVDAVADAVYCGYADETNAGKFPGLKLSRAELREGIASAHAHGAEVLVTIDTGPRPGALGLRQDAVDKTVAAGADALILADLGLPDHAARIQACQRLHVSVQAAANPQAIRFYVGSFGVKRVVLPRVQTVAEGAAIARAISARCCHARAHGLHKDNCRFVCGADPDGMPVETREAGAFLAINGLQTLSHAAMNLIEDIPC